MIVVPWSSWNSRTCQFWRPLFWKIGTTVVFIPRSSVIRRLNSLEIVSFRLLDWELDPRIELSTVCIVRWFDRERSSYNLRASIAEIRLGFHFCRLTWNFPRTYLTCFGCENFKKFVYIHASINARKEISRKFLFIFQSVFCQSACTVIYLVLCSIIFLIYQR